MSNGAHPSGCLIFKKKDQVIPESYLAVALEKNPTYYGMTYLEKGKITMLSGEQPTLAELTDLLEICKKDGVFLHLGYDPNGKIVDENYQPFKTLVAKDGPLFVSLLAGDFSRFRSEDASGISGEANFSTNVLQGMLNDFLIQAKQDPDVVMDLLKQSYVAKLMHCVTDSGVIVIMNKNGKLQKFSSAPNYEKFLWGWTSDNYGWKPAAVEPATPAQPEAPSVVTETPTESPAVAPPIPNEEIKEAAEAAIPVDMGKKAHGGVVSSKDGKTYIAPPPDASNWGNKKVRQWYISVFGTCPKRDIWEKLLPLEAPKSFQQSATVVPIPTAPTPNVHETPVAPAAPTTQPDVKPAAAIKGQNKVSMAEEGKIKALFLDKSSNRIPSPADIAAFDEKIPPFVTQLKLSGLEDTFSVSYESLVKLGAPESEGGIGRPDLLARLLFDYRLEYFKLLSELHQNAEAEKAEEDTSVVVTPPSPAVPTLTDGPVMPKKKRSAMASMAA